MDAIIITAPETKIKIRATTLIIKKAPIYWGC
jgi:hypothetical protein